MPQVRKYVPSHSGGMEPWPSRANSRISSSRSQANFSRFNRSTFCAFVSFTSVIPAPLGSKRVAPKTKNPRCLDLWHVGFGTSKLCFYYVRCSLKPEMDVSRHIQQSHGQQIVWQEKFMLPLKYAKTGNVSTELRATLSIVRICFLDARARGLVTARAAWLAC